MAMAIIYKIDYHPVDHLEAIFLVTHKDTYIKIIAVMDTGMVVFEEEEELKSWGPLLQGKSKHLSSVEDMCRALLRINYE